MITETLDATDVRAEAQSWPERAKTTRIIDALTYTKAGELLKGIKALRLKIAETFDPHIRRAYEAHRALVKEKAEAETPLTDAEKTLKSALVAYDDQQERIRRAEERRLQELARQQEEERRLADAAALELEADRTGDAQLREEAHDLITQPIQAPVVQVQKSTPKVTGIAFREVWSARVVDVRKLIAFVAAHPECANYLTPNVTALNAAVRAQKQGFKVDGVQAHVEKVAAASGR